MVRSRDVRVIINQVGELQRRIRREVPQIDGISWTSMRVLGSIDRYGERSQPSMVAEDLKMATPNVSTALRELESERLITRRRDQADARRSLLKVTAKGQRALAETRNERDSWLGRAMDAMLTPEERRTMLAAGELMQRLAQYDGPTAPQQATSRGRR